MVRQRTAGKSGGKRARDIKETITYPRLQVNEWNPDPCVELSMPYEHLLSCGHVIHTSEPNERCGKNCRHIVNAKKNPLKKHSGFFCQACVEEDIEEQVKDEPNLAIQEQLRTELRELEKEEQMSRNVNDKPRPCYLAIKTVSVRCDEDGQVSSYYKPIPGHRFDTSIPPAGANMFEDIPTRIVKHEIELETENEPITDLEHDKASSGVSETEQLDVETVVEYKCEGTAGVYQVKLVGVNKADDRMPATQLYRFKHKVTAYDNAFMQSKSKGCESPLAVKPKRTNLSGEKRQRKPEPKTKPKSTPTASKQVSQNSRKRVFNDSESDYFPPQPKKKRVLASKR